MGTSQTPDYELELAGVSVLAEIKQIDSNDADEAMTRGLAETGFAHLYREPPGERTWRKIRKAAPQLRKNVTSEQAAIVVVFNNVSVASSTDPISMMAGMHGLRALTAEQNTTASAVCVLFDGPAGPSLAAFHNIYAAVRLRPDDLRRLCTFQYRCEAPGMFSEWIPV